MPIPGCQSRTESPHQSGNGGAGDIAADFQLKAAQHGIVQEGAALHHDILAQIIGTGCTDYLIDGIFHNGNRQSRGNILHRRPVLLSLFDRRIHKHCAARAQVCRSLGKQPQLGKGGNVISHGFGKRLNKASAAGGACLIEHDGIHGIIADFEALHILSANVNNVIHLGIEILGRREMGHRFYKPQITAESIFNQILAIACDSTSRNMDARFTQFVNFAQLLEHNVYRVPLIGTIIGKENAAVFSNQHHLCRSGTCVNTKISFSHIAVNVRFRQMIFVVTLQKGIIFRLRGKQRRQGIETLVGIHSFFQPVQHFIKQNARIIRRTHG